MLTETDLELVDAVQVNPRASWSKIGAILDVSAMTVSRHWARLVAERVVWSGSTMGPRLFRGAILEFSCQPGATEDVIDQLCAMPHVFTVARTTGDFDVYALTVAPTPDALARSLFGPLQHVQALARRSTVYTRLYGGPHWRLSILNRTQSEQMRPDAERPLHHVTVDSTDRALFLALAADARRSFTELAAELGETPQSVRRRLERMRRSGHFALRADMARPMAGWPLAALIWASVPHQELDTVGHHVGSWSEIRFCAAVVHSSNLLLVVNLRASEHLADIETRLLAAHPALTITDRRLVLRMSKVNGHLLDDEGRTRGVVPVDPWSPSGV
ncbi:Lrp/AsnC family transcriptional regulator [Mycolicibacterium mengxianglii]|uniref:Lrp/AsnC family transcriptional regulator n=1 Tax=Mycolicibacterium mengxianglii TaxID=2736649 RepID=UPI0018D148B2|nr:AsnC family transcriptional regulator [Mycolicibacterium mengxianglii]